MAAKYLARRMLTNEALFATGNEGNGEAKANIEQVAASSVNSGGNIAIIERYRREGVAAIAKEGNNEEVAEEAGDI